MRQSEQAAPRLQTEIRTQTRRGAILLGGAHGTLAIARSLGRRGIPVWLVTDDSPLAKLSRYVTRSFTWPGPRDEGALRFLGDLHHRCGLSGWMLFPGSDADLRFVAQNHAALSTVFTLTTPAWETVRFAYDKRQMNARAAMLGLPYPGTYYPRAHDDLAEIDLPFPVILKPTVREARNAFVDAKAWRADNGQVLRARYEQAKALVGTDNIMIQELIPGDGSAQFSYAGIWDRGAPIGALVARRRRQYPVEFGFTSTLVETIDAPEIEAAAVRFLTSLDYSGLVEIEFKFDGRQGLYKILDVNARAWTWIALGAAAGLDFPAIAWQLASGEAVNPRAARSGVKWVYFARDLVACLHEIASGRLSPGDYIRSLRRASSAAVFAWDDPWPAALDIPLSAARVLSRRSLRSRTAKTALQSARLPSR
jgi:predicted ATP-grasp superfamily ATP-dependent carboligase